MSPQTLETLFLRFCEDCDPAAMAEVFDRAAPELRPLARHLMRGRVESDDLIQETFLAAIEHRASYDPARPLMPWLVGILVRQASSARRRSRRDLDPERLHQPVSGAPEDELESSEFQRVVLEALSRLSRHDRDVLVPLLFDGKRAVQIARELGHRPDTIRMRIHRGLSRLRQVLPSSVALPGIVIFGRGWNDVRQNVLSAAARNVARAGGPPIAVPAGGGLSVAGAWIAIALLGCLAIAWREGVLGGVPDSVPGPDVASLPVPALDTSQPLPEVESTDGRTAVAQAPAVLERAPLAAVGGLVLEGTVRGLEAQEWRSTSIEVHGLGPDPILSHQAALLREDGTFETDVAPLARLGARRFLVRVDHSEHVPAEVRVERGEVERLSAGTIELAPAFSVEGTVHDAAGAPLGGASVGLYSMLEGAQDVNALDLLETGADGHFRLRSPSRGAHVVIAFREGSRPATRWVSLAESTVEAQPMRLEPGLSIAGVVRAPELSASGVRVRCEASPPPMQRRLRLADRRFTRVDDRYELATGIATCDSAGNFAFTGLCDRTFDVSVVLVAGVDAVAWDPVPAAARIGASGVRPPRFDLDLELPWSILDFEFVDDGRASDASGDDRAIDVVLLPEPRYQHMQPVSVRLRPGRGEHARVQVHPGARYQVELAGFASAGESLLVLEAKPAGGTLYVPLEVRAANARASLVLHLAGASLAVGEQIGVGFFPADHAAEGADLGDLSGALFERSAPLDADQRLTLDDLPPGSWHARLRIGGTYSRPFGSFLPCAVDVELSPGATCERSVRTERGGGARLRVISNTGSRLSARGRLFDASGAEHLLRCIALDPESVREEAGRVVLNAYNELGPLRPGQWRLELTAIGFEPLTLPFEVELGRVVELEARLRPR